MVMLPMTLVTSN